MSVSYEEWLKQSAYDMETAEYMLRGGRTFYAVFMCHLAIEKAIKRLYQYELSVVPPKTHDLVYLLGKIGIKPPRELGVFLASLTEAQVATRYPEDLETVIGRYTEQSAGRIIVKGKEALEWTRARFSK